MTLEEKIAFINSEKEKNYLYISPRRIHGGANLVHDYDSLALYENMDHNTKGFAERKITSLRTISRILFGDVSENLELYLIFCGDFDDLPDKKMSYTDFVREYKDKIVAVSKHLENVEKRNYFMNFPQSDYIHHYGYTYLNFAELLKIFNENNVGWMIDNTIDRSIYNDEDVTKFKITYNPINEMDNDIQELKLSPNKNGE